VHIKTRKSSFTKHHSATEYVGQIEVHRYIFPSYWFIAYFVGRYVLFLLGRNGSFEHHEGGESTSSYYRLNVYRYIPNYDPAYGMNSKNLKPLNPRVIFSVYHGEQRVGVGIVGFGEKVQIDDNLYLIFTGVQPFSTFKVKADPGAPVVAAGGGLLLLGILLFCCSQ